MSALPLPLLLLLGLVGLLRPPVISPFSAPNVQFKSVYSAPCGGGYDYAEFPTLVSTVFPFMFLSCADPHAEKLSVYALNTLNQSETADLSQILGDQFSVKVAATQEDPNTGKGYFITVNYSIGFSQDLWEIDYSTNGNLPFGQRFSLRSLGFSDFLSQCYTNSFWVSPQSNSFVFNCTNTWKVVPMNNASAPAVLARPPCYFSLSASVMTAQIGGTAYDNLWFLCYSNSLDSYLVQYVPIIPPFTNGGALQNATTVTSFVASNEVSMNTLSFAASSPSARLAYTTNGTLYWSSNPIGGSWHSASFSSQCQASSTIWSIAIGSGGNVVLINCPYGQEVNLGLSVTLSPTPSVSVAYSPGTIIANPHIPFGFSPVTNSFLSTSASGPFSLSLTPSGGFSAFAFVGGAVGAVVSVGLSSHDGGTVLVGGAFGGVVSLSQSKGIQTLQGPLDCLSPRSIVVDDASSRAFVACSALLSSYVNQSSAQVIQIDLTTGKSERLINSTECNGFTGPLRLSRGFLFQACSPGFVVVDIANPKSRWIDTRWSGTSFIVDPLATIPSNIAQLEVIYSLGAWGLDSLADMSTNGAGNAEVFLNSSECSTSSLNGLYNQNLQLNVFNDSLHNTLYFPCDALQRIAEVEPSGFVIRNIQTCIDQNMNSYQLAEISVDSQGNVWSSCDQISSLFLWNGTADNNAVAVPIDGCEFIQDFGTASYQGKDFVFVNCEENVYVNSKSLPQFGDFLPQKPNAAFGRISFSALPAFIAMLLGGGIFKVSSRTLW